MTQGGTYTILRHDMFDSPAAAVLSPVERDVLMFVLRTWYRVTRNETKNSRGVAITWSVFPYPISRPAFSRARRGLEQRGFIVAVNRKVGTFALADGWSRYTPTFEEQERLDKNAVDKEVRKRETAQRRGKQIDPTTRKSRVTQIDPTPAMESVGRVTQINPTHGTQGVTQSDHPQGNGSLHQVGSQFVTHNNTTNTSIPPLTPQQGEGAGGSLRIREDIKKTLDGFTKHIDLVSWKPPLDLTDDEISYAEQRSDELHARVQRGPHWADNADPFALPELIAKKLQAPHALGEITQSIKGRENQAVATVDAILRDSTVKAPLAVFRHRIGAMV